MNDMQRLAAEANLRHMLAKGWISICDIDQMIKIAQVVPDREAYDTLRLLHCVNFTQMDPVLVKEIPDLLRKTLGGVSIKFDNVLSPRLVSLNVIDAVVVEERPKPKGILSWLK